MADYGTQEEMKPEHFCRADMCGGERVDGSELCSMHKRYADARTEREAKAKADAQALDDVAVLDNAACRYGTRLDIPSKIPGFDPGDADHIHFVMMPIGAAARRAAVEWLKRLGMPLSYDSATEQERAEIIDVTIYQPIKRSP